MGYHVLVDPYEPVSLFLRQLTELKGIHPKFYPNFTKSRFDFSTSVWYAIGC